MKIVVIGGGPAGVMAASEAAILGAQVLLIEQNSYLCKKMGITGKGRCNITNASDISDFINNIPLFYPFLPYWEQLSSIWQMFFPQGVFPCL